MSMVEFYSYLNLESTKTCVKLFGKLKTFYSYLNLESTKTTISESILNLQVLQLLNLKLKNFLIFVPLH